MLCKRTFTVLNRSLTHGGVGYPLRRGPLMVSVANAGDKNRRFQTAGTKNQQRYNERPGETNPLKRMTAAYKTTDFQTTLAEAPRHVLWTVIASATPLVVKPLFAGLADYPEFAVGYVSLYVIVANGWMLAGRDDRDGLFSSWTPLWTFLGAVSPLVECATAVAVLSPSIGLLVVGHAAFKTAVLLIDDPVAENSWRRSTVLLVFGISTTSLTIALITALFA